MDPATSPLTSLLAPVPVDGTDPLVVMLTWALTFAVGRWCKKHMKKWRHAMPVIAVLGAVALRSGIGAVQGEELNASTALRALAAGAVAVFSHSQIREIQKFWETQRDDRQERLYTPPPASRLPEDKTVPTAERRSTLPPGESA